MAWLVTILFLLITYYLAKKDIIWGVAWLTFLVPSYLVRMNLFGIPTTALELGIYLVFVLFLLRVWRSRTKFKWESIFSIALVWILIGLVSALLVSDDPISSLGLWKGWIVDPVLVMIVVACELRYRTQVKFLYQAFVFLLGMMGFLAIWQFITATVITDDGRVSTFFSSANYLAMLMVPALLFVLAKFLKEKSVSWLEIVFCLMGLSALVLSASYIGLLSFLLGGLFLSWSVFTKNIKGFLLVILAAVVLAAFFLMIQPDPERFSKMIDLTERSSVTVRIQVWEVAFNLIKENGLWGVGLGNFQKSYFNIVGSIFDPPMEWRMLHAHNLYLQSWLEMTFFGLLALLTIFIVWWAKIIKLMKSVDYYWFYGILAIILAWVVGGFFDTPLYKNDLAFLFWLLIGIIWGSNKIYLCSVRK